MKPGMQVEVDGVMEGDRVFNGMTGVVIEVWKPEYDSETLARSGSLVRRVEFGLEP